MDKRGAALNPKSAWIETADVNIDQTGGESIAEPRNRCSSERALSTNPEDGL
jgi:hypothetical protein